MPIGLKIKSTWTQSGQLFRRHMDRWIVIDFPDIFTLIESMLLDKLMTFHGIYTALVDQL